MMIILTIVIAMGLDICPGVNHLLFIFFLFFVNYGQFILHIVKFVLKKDYFPCIVKILGEEFAEHAWRGLWLALVMLFLLKSDVVLLLLLSIAVAPPRLVRLLFLFLLFFQRLLEHLYLQLQLFVLILQIIF